MSFETPLQSKVFQVRKTTRSDEPSEMVFYAFEEETISVALVPMTAGFMAVSPQWLNPGLGYWVLIGTSPTDIRCLSLDLET